MSRDIEFDEDEICDVCGSRGAYDFMGDCLCAKCASECIECDIQNIEDIETE